MKARQTSEIHSCGSDYMGIASIELQRFSEWITRSLKNHPEEYSRKEKSKLNKCVNSIQKAKEQLEEAQKHYTAYTNC